MEEQGRKIFHESWYRIANERVSLRSSVRVHRQLFQGKQWYVLHDAFNNQFYRLPPVAYEFVARLNLKRTVEEIWYQILELFPDDAPGQGEVIELLSQLYQANMLHYHMPEDSQQLFRRRENRRQQLVKSTLLNILYLRIPLFDPDPLLKRLMPLIRMLFSRAFFMVWIAVVIYGIKLAVDHFDVLQNQAQGFLAPSNLFLIYITTFAIKILHEFGHSFAVRRYGGEVHAIGIMFMLLAPLPYMDATAAWSFRSRWQRILVGASGMLTEFFIAAIAMIVWAHVGGGPIKAVAYNTLIIASVTTLLFNINPLMRFDGYYILSDLIDIPNLYQNASRYLQYWLERYIFRRRDAQSVAHSPAESTLYAVYGISAALYRIVLFGGIVLAVSEHYLLLSVIMGSLLLFSWLVTPLFKFIKYLLTSPGLALVRARAVVLVGMVFGALWALFTLVPIPDTFTAPAVMKAVKYQDVITGTQGQVVRMPLPSESWVQAGDTLVVLNNPPLQFEKERIQAQISEQEHRYFEALSKAPENMMPIQRKLQVLQQSLQKLQEEQGQLVVTASQNGLWISPEAHTLKGKWVRRGDSLGTLVDTTDFQMIAAIPQNEVSRLYETNKSVIHTRLKGSAWIPLFIDRLYTVPLEQTRLASAALGWQGGGDIETDPTDPQGLSTVEPFYEIRGHVPRRHGEVRYAHGRTGLMRVKTGYRPLLPQLWRKLRQTLQKYYRL